MAVYSIDLPHRPTSSLADILIVALCTLNISSKNLAFNGLQMWLLAAVRVVNSSSVYGFNNNLSDSGVIKKSAVALNVILPEPETEVWVRIDQNLYRSNVVRLGTKCGYINAAVRPVGPRAGLGFLGRAQRTPPHQLYKLPHWDKTLNFVHFETWKSCQNFMKGSRSRVCA